MIAEAVYILCATTSALCAWLLLRAYQRTGTRILLWSGFAFVGLALYNSLYYVDFFVLPSADLSAVRMIPAVIGLGLLCYGLIWEST